MSLRYESYHNGKTATIDLDVSKGQNQKIVKIPPDQWSVMWHHPDIMECFCIQHFESIAERNQHIDEVLHENSFEHDKR